MKATYKVTISFLAEKDDYNEGLTGDIGASWTEVAEFRTLKEVKEFVRDWTYSGYNYIEYDTYLKRYITAYQTTDENVGEMSEREMQAWKDGEINGWTVSCDITVQKLTPKIIGNVKFN